MISYVVVSVGETDSVPLLSTAPIPLSIEHVVVSVELHESVLDSPGSMRSGVAVSVTVGGRWTVTVAVAVAVPAKPVAVMV